KILPELFPLRPTNIRRALKLNRPIYRRTAAYGHFGRAPEKDGGFSWERTDLADALKRSFRYSRLAAVRSVSTQEAVGRNDPPPLVLLPSAPTSRAKRTVRRSERT